MNDLMNKTAELANEAKELFSRGMNAEQVIEQTNASGLAEKMIRSAWADWKMSDKLLVSTINGRAISVHYKKGDDYGL